MSELINQPTVSNVSEERLRVAQAVRALETNPLGAEAERQRRQLKSWIDEAPDLSVPVVPELLPSLESATTGRAQEIFTQMILSSAAYSIEHPGKAADDAAVCIAGLEGALRAYEAILVQEPDCRRPELDAMTGRMRAGTLPEHVAQVLARVGREPKGLRRFFSFQGRIGRKSFWLRVLGGNIVGLLLLVPAFFLATSNSEAVGVVLGLFYIVSVFLLVAFFFATEVQRWHDLGYSGYMLFLNFIPLIGGLISLVWLGFVKGESGPNKYGDDPLQ